MSIPTNAKTGKKDANSKFSGRGWLIVFLGMAMWFFAAAMTVEGANLIIPAFSTAYNVSAAALYGIATVASLISIPGVAACGALQSKIGPRKIILLCWTVAACGMGVLGLARNLTVYCIGRVLMGVGTNCANYIGLNGIITNWFPRKKGLVLGYVTMGSNLSTALCLYLIGFLLTKLSLSGTFFIWGAIYLALGLLSFVLLRDNPEEMGEFPDNDRTLTQEQVQEQFHKGEEYRKAGGMTTMDILKKRQSWQIAFGYGIILLITVGVLSTLVSTLIIKGLPELKAVSIMTIAAVLGIPFSYLWGYLDVKFSTKKATMLLYCVIFAMIAFMLIPGTWTAYVTAVLLGCFIGAGNNLTPAIIATVFGRYDFSKALAVIMPIWNIVVAFATTVVGVPQSLTGSYVAAYIVLAVVAVIGFVLVITLDDHCIGKQDV
mgnify:CR=1 FL=1